MIAKKESWGNNMIRSQIKKEFECDQDQLWEIITNNYQYEWRSDLSHILVINEKEFVEYTKQQVATKFTIVTKEKLKEYRFCFENDQIKGNWIGLFTILPNGHIVLDFTEEVEVKKWPMRLLAKPYLKQQQKKYMRDLKQALDHK